MTRGDQDSSREIEVHVAETEGPVAGWRPVTALRAA